MRSVKKYTKLLFAVSAIFSILAGGAPYTNSAFGQSLPPNPEGFPLITMTLDTYEVKACNKLLDPLLGFDSYFNATFFSVGTGTGYAIEDGDYPGYCADLVGTVRSGPYPVKFYLSMDPNLPVWLKEVTYKPIDPSTNKPNTNPETWTTYTIPWNEINYILNPPGPNVLGSWATATWLDKQAAIWTLVHGCVPTWTLLPNPPTETKLFDCPPLFSYPDYPPFPYGDDWKGCPTYFPYPPIVNQDMVDRMVNAANMNGSSFIPQSRCQMVTAVVDIIEVSGVEKQVVFIPVQIPCPPSQAGAVTLSNLTQTYTGSQLWPTATTNPADLPIVWTGAPQTNAGAYPVTATSSDPNHPGSDSGIFLINKATPTLSVTNSPAPYNGSSQGANVSSGSVAGVVSNVKYDGSSTVPTNAKTYAITADFAPTDTANYNSLTEAFAEAFAGYFTITQKAASVTPSAASKAYGTSDPTLTGMLAGFVASDNVTATYSRTAGETVAGSPYTISATLSPSGVLGNYYITYNTAAFTITPKAASVTPNPASKTYGDPDPALTGTLSGFLAGDNVTASYSRTPGATVGSYTISATLSPAGVLSNYTITYNTAAFTITPKAASVTPNPASKTSGASDPVLTGTLNGFLASDNVTATYSRAAGESDGTYTISATLSPTNVVGNYNITYNTGLFTIKAATTTGFIIPIDVTLHTVDQKKSGACGYDSFGRARGECKNQIPYLQARVFDMKALQAAYGTNPSKGRYDEIYEEIANVPSVSTCTTDAYGEALCYVPKVSDYLVILKYEGPANIKYPSYKKISMYPGKKVPAGSFQSRRTNTEFHGDLKLVNPPGALWARDVDIHLKFHLIRTINRDKDERNERDGRCDYGDGARSVYQGSYLEIIYPSYTVWEEGVNDYVYPFILTGDSDWTVDICTAVPQGYQIVGVYDVDSNLISSTSCAQAGVAGETKVVAFTVVDLQSPPPSLSADVGIKHKGKTEKARFETRGYRKGKDKKDKKDKEE